MRAIQSILSKGTDVNAVDRSRGGRTALIWALNNGHTYIVKYLLESTSARTDIADTLGETALIRASLQGHFDIVKLLIANGANVEVRDKSNRTALLWGSTREYSVVESLIDA